MAPIVSIKELNRKSYLAYHRDGIIDILLGLTFLGFGLWLLLDNVLFTYISWLSFSFYRSLKKALTIPRIGFVRFEEDRKQRILLLLVGILLLALLIAARFYLLDEDLSGPLLPAFLRNYHVFIMSGIGAGLLLIFGFWRGIYRFAGYGILLAAALGFCLLEGIPGRSALFFMAGLVVTSGIILLITFIQQHPQKSLEVDNAV